MESGNEPATRRDVEQLRSEFQHGFDNLKEAMRDVQTELLKSLYGFTERRSSRGSRRRTTPKRDSRNASPYSKESVVRHHFVTSGLRIGSEVLLGGPRKTGPYRQRADPPSAGKRIARL